MKKILYWKIEYKGSFPFLKFDNFFTDEPIVTIPLPNYNGQFGGNVELTCNVVANPSATVVYWTKTVGGQTTTIGQSTGKYSFSVNSPSLMISNLDASDKASYTCYATNSIGSGNSQPTTLDVIGSKFIGVICLFFLT